MNSLDVLIQAINERKSISFQYNKIGKIEGERIGSPYAVFIFTSKKGEKSTKVHLVQTGGVSDTKDSNPFPNFRMFNIKDLTQVTILSNSEPFEGEHDSYNPEWDGYSNVLAKI